MHHFSYIDGHLTAESVPLEAIAQAVGTPFYCYSSATLRHHVQVINEAFAAARLSCRIHFAIKANPNRQVLALLSGCGCGVDAVSEGEVRLALSAGVPARDIIFSGVGKTDEEIAFALRAGVHSLNVESLAEMEAVAAISAHLGVKTQIGIRLNPDTKTDNHSKVATGHGASKFGVPLSMLAEVVEWARAHQQLEVRSLSMHIGSQITSMQPYELAFAKLAQAGRDVMAAGVQLDYLDLGGGLGVPYGDNPSPPPLPKVHAQVAAKHMRGLGLPVVIEPGRVIAANAGVLVGTVIYRKASAHKQFLITDVGMNDLVRPTLYEAWHEILPLEQAVIDRSAAGGARAAAGGEGRADVVGPLCESGDYVALQRELPAYERGDRFALMGTGAYGAAMANEYNSRRRVAEVLVEGSRYSVVRPRRSYEQMLAEHPDLDWQQA